MMTVQRVPLATDSRCSRENREKFGHTLSLSHVHSFVVSIVPRKWRFPRIKLVVEGMTDLSQIVGDTFLQRKKQFKN